MHYLDFSIILVFFIGISLYGIYQSRKNKSQKDFFLAGKNVSWITAMFSIVATETSVLTFISVPGIAYRGDWTFLQLSIGYIFGRVIVSFFLIPLFFKDGITSIYQILEHKFNVKIQRLASLTFLITRIFADGVRFAAIAIVIQALTSWSIVFSILVIGFVTLIYTVLGGLKSVIHIDAFQFFIYLISAFICIFSIFSYADISSDKIIIDLYNNSKFKIFDFQGNIFIKPFMFFSAFIGGSMLSIASHGADYMMVQRVLATKSIKDAKKAMIGSGIFVFLQFSLFLLIGSLIYYVSSCTVLPKDSEISYVILNILPVGFKGIVIAGILSAAMSTLSSSINSLSSSTINDWFPSYNSIGISRIVSLFWTVVLILVALFFQSSNDALVIVGLKIASFTYGSLLSFFILSKFNVKFNNISVVAGYAMGIIIVFYLLKYNISWTFYIISSVLINISIVMLFHFIKNKVIKYFLLGVPLVTIFPLIFEKDISKQFASSNTNIIDIKVKDSCLKNNIYSGFDIFKENYNSFLNIMDVGIVVNHTSQMISINEKNKKISVNLSDTHLYVKKIFTPEHGLNNNYEAGEKILGDIDYNIPIISLYGKDLKPNKNDLENLDAIIFDIQDIGSRYYTYVSTMTEVMKSCAELNIPFYVFDRPNPIGGIIQGPILKDEYKSFVGMHPIPIRHGMTIGELAYMINEMGWLGDNLKVDLNIIKMQGWSRSMYFEETGLKWVPPSPNIADVNTSIIYSGMCLIEGTNLSEGRGTDFPFLQFGAPWLDSETLLNNMNDMNLPGVEFLKVNFIPRFIPSKATYPKFINQECKGLKILIDDRSKINPILITIKILNEVKKIHPNEFKFLSSNFIDKLYGSDLLKNNINTGLNIDELIGNWKYDYTEFESLSKKFRIY